MYFYDISFIFSYSMQLNAKRIRHKLLALRNEKNGPMSRHGYQNISLFQVRCYKIL